jgi:hypothetical protein
MKTLRITTLACLFALLFAGHSFSAQPVTEDPVNIVAWTVGYDYREDSPPYWYPDSMGGQTMFVGSEGISGGYFLLAALINPGLGGCLTDHSQIREVKAKWLGDLDFEFSLLPDTCFNQVPFAPPAFHQSQAWALFMRPQSWDFTGTWAFTLKYNCPTDGLQHKQTREVQPNPPNTIPPKPTGILIERSSNQDYFYVSWTGMGNPLNHPWFGYRVVVYSDEDNCPTNFYGTGFSQWSYADGPNRITVNVPIAHVGKTIRIENRNSYGMAGPPFPSGTLGGSPNRALVRTRLPY